MAAIWPNAEGRHHMTDLGWLLKHSARALTVMIITSALASADSVTVHFTAYPDPADVLNSPSSGTFAYDTSLIPPGGGQLQDPHGLDPSRISISFLWGGAAYDNSNAGVGTLRFAPDGTLEFWVLGGLALNIFGYTVAPAGSVIDDFHMTPAGWNYTLRGIAGSFQGRVEADTPSTVPEPSSMILIGTVCVILAGRRLTRIRPLLQTTRLIGRLRSGISNSRAQAP